MTFSFLILSWAVSDEFTAPFGIFGLTLTVMLVKGLIQRFYLNNLTNLLIKALREKMIGRFSHQPDCRVRVCIWHQLHRSILISCTNHSVWEFFSRTWCYGIRRPCTKNDITQKYWTHLISVMVFGLRKSLVD